MSTAIKTAMWLLIISLSLLFYYYDGAFVLQENKELPIKNTDYKKDSIGVYLVNLDRAPDRLAKVSPMIESLGLPFKRVAAVDGKNVPKSTLEKVLDKDAYFNYIGVAPEVGTVGCYLSHLNIWEEFLGSEYQYALVFEDDVSFIPEKVKNAVDELIKKPNLWDICSFEIRHRGMPLSIDHMDTGLQLSVYAINISNAGAYLINRHAAIQLLRYAYPIKMPIDHFFTRTWELDIKFRGIEPRIVHQTFGDSYIVGGNRVETSKYSNLGQILHKSIYNTKTSIMRFINALQAKLVT